MQPEDIAAGLKEKEKEKGEKEEKKGGTRTCAQARRVHIRTDESKC